MDKDFIVGLDGSPLKLGFQPTPAYLREPNMRAIPPVPESDWLEIDRREIFWDLGWYAYQASTSGCTGFSAATKQSKVRVLLGQPPEELSGAYLYSLINGGQDAGSNIGAALKALETYGCCRKELCDISDSYNNIWRKNTKQHDADAARFKAEMSFPGIETAIEAMSAMQRGVGLLEFAVRVEDGWRPNSDGVLPFFPGPANHAVHADGCKRIGKYGWCLDMQTWGEKQFGYRGRAFVPLSYLEKTKYQEMWSVIGTIDDPQDEHDPPEPVAI